MSTVSEAVKANDLSEEVKVSSRKADFEIDPLFLNRWSPRSFTGEEIPDTILHSVFEAARWAPSGSNLQPWRFLYSKRGSSSWGKFFGFIKPQ